MNASRRSFVLSFMASLALCAWGGRLPAQTTDPPAAHGERAIARVKIEAKDLPPASSLTNAPAGKLASVEAKEFHLTHNQVGAFQRVQVRPKARLPIEVTYPDAHADEAVIVQDLDGGKLDAGVRTKHDRLDALKKLSFVFELPAQPGLYRVSVRKGKDVKVLEFWVGDPLPQAKAKGAKNN